MFFPLCMLRNGGDDVGRDQKGNYADDLLCLLAPSMIPQSCLFRNRNKRSGCVKKTCFL